VAEDPWLKDIPAIADHALAIIDRFNEFKHIQGLSIEEIAKEESIKRRKEREDREKSIWTKLDGLNCTHFGNADRFLAWHSDVVRYCPPFEWWFFWVAEEGRWKRDEAGIISELGKFVILKIYEEASKLRNEDRRKALASWAIRCETPGTVNQMLEVARSCPDVVIMPGVFDNENHLINLKNGYYDLNTHVFSPHDQSHFFSMILPFKYDPHASCHGWLSFLDRIFKSNPEKEKIISFLQRAIGYTLTGDTSERAIFLMHGLGANGKSVFIRVLEALFGEYGASVSSVTFTTAMATNVRNDLARLVGKRFVWASENSSDTVLDEENIKRWTGGDTVVCRFLFKEEFTYRPNFKIWWVFNHKPKIKDATDSIWDRIHLIPCEERIPLDQQDKHLTEKLIVELPGIFNWAITGLKEFQLVGLLAPSSVKEATKEYRNSEDVLADFLSETFDDSQQSLGDIRMPFKRIWELWTAWCNANNEKIRSKTWLGRQLGDRFKKYHDMHEKGYLGLKVKSP
jgi:putative DNA primase/helicase